MTQARPAVVQRHAAPARPLLPAWRGAVRRRHLALGLPAPAVRRALQARDRAARQRGAPSMVVGLASLLLWVLMGVGAARPALSGPRPIRVVARPVPVQRRGLVRHRDVAARRVERDQPRRRRDPGAARLVRARSCWRTTASPRPPGATCSCGGWPSRAARWPCSGWRSSRSASSSWTGSPCPGLTLTSPYELGERNGLYPPRRAPRPTRSSTACSITMLLPLTLHVGFQHTERRPLLRWAPAAARSPWCPRRAPGPPTWAPPSPW